MMWDAMLLLTPDKLESWKVSFARDGIVYETDEEYYEAMDNFVNFFETLVQIDRRIKDSPNTDDHDGAYLLGEDGRKIIL